MKLFWIDAPAFADSRLGYGITAHDAADALSLLAEHFRLVHAEDDFDPALASVRRIEDLAEIEQNHVRPNMGNHMRRGIWYPGLNHDHRGF